MKIEWVPRSEWGSTAVTEEFIHSRRSQSRLIKTEIQVHHTAATDTDDSTPNRWDYSEAQAYMRRLQFVRPDLGPLPYSENLACSEDLETVWAFEGRGVLKQGAHTKGHNVPGVGFGVFGDFDKPDVDAAARLITAIQDRCHFYKTDPNWRLINLGSVLSPHGWTAWGHRDSSNKSCPGNSLYPQLADFVIEPLQQGEEEMLPLVMGDDNEDVRLAKDRINETYGTKLSLASTVYDPGLKVAAAKHLGKYTGEPAGQRGDKINANMWNGLLRDFILKVGGGGDHPDKDHSSLATKSALASHVGQELSGPHS